MPNIIIRKNKIIRRKPVTSTAKLSKAQRRSVGSIISHQLGASLNIQYTNASTVNITPASTAGGLVVKMINVAAGSGEGTREGNRIMLKSARFSYWISGSNTTYQSTPNPKYLVMIVQDNQSSGDLFLSTPYTNQASAASGLNLFSATADYSTFGEMPPEWDAPDRRYKILYRKEHTLTGWAYDSTQAAGTGTLSTETKQMTKNISFGKGLDIKYSGTAANTNTNAMIYMVVMGQGTTGYINYYWRSIYAD